MAEPVTLITGTRKGIGKFLAHHLVGRGHRVVGCSRSRPDWHLEGYDHHLADVGDEAQVKKIFAGIRKTYGRLDHLINNAGIASMNHCLLTPLSQVREVLNTNVAGVFLCCREAAKLMQIRKFGRIVNMASVATPLKLEGEAVYAASKAAVISLTEIMARELAAFGITVNALGPTPVETDLIRGVPRDKMDRLLSRQAIPRFATFADLANVIDFYLKPESSFVTGQTLFLGGI
jgi:3-oxoacyl-[acyl-carrier protein] reductase